MRKQEETLKDHVTPRRLEPEETHPPRNDIQEQRGGPQTDQITGQTEKGARTQNDGRAH